MTIIVGITKTGIIVAEATPAAAGALGAIVRDVVQTGVPAAGNVADAAAIAQSIQSSLTGNPTEAISVLGGTMAGGVVTVAVMGSALTPAAIAAAAAAAGIILSPAAIAVAVVVAAAAAGYAIGEIATDVLRDMQNNDDIVMPDGRPFKMPNFPLGDSDGNGIPDIHENRWIDPKTGQSFKQGQNWVQRRDPLTFDLDGDGLETTAIAATNPILFDHDGDGVKNGTGWVNADDGFLVRDVNGNGTIDSGRELFGDSTIKSNGQLATDGFNALADLDSVTNGGNADGKISNLDAQFTNLRIWRDLNQDGISQTNELFTLSTLNIASINVAKTANSQTLANGNQIADIGSYTKTDGSQVAVGEVTGSLADINLASDTFHRTFPNVLDTTSVATLPDMQGSGAVRDLREAAAQSSTLQSLLTQFSAATTRAGQMALIDQLLDAWADTGGMAESMTQRVAGMAGFTKADGTVIPYTLSSNLTADWTQKLHIIESFNGLTIATPTATSTSVQITANLMQNQLDLLQQSYDAIKGSVYDALVLQTRFKPLLDQINLVIDASGINLDFTQVNAAFDANIRQNAANDNEWRVAA